MQPWALRILGLIARWARSCWRAGRHGGPGAVGIRAEATFRRRAQLGFRRASSRIAAISTTSAGRHV